MSSFRRIVLILITHIIPCFLCALAKEEGMGEQAVAYPQGPTSANFNPAGITEVRDGWDADIAMLYQNGRNYIKGSENPAFNMSASNTQAKYIPIGSAGICKKITPQLTIGLSIDATRSGKGSQKPFPQFGHGRHQGVDSLIGILVPTIAWKVNECHSLGLSTPVSFGRFKLNGLQNLAVASVAPNDFSNRGYNWAYGFGLRFGWLWHITPRLTFGAYYSPNLLTASHFHKYKGFIPLRGKLQVPPTVRVGLAYAWGRAHIATELEWNFNKFERTLHNPPDSTALYGSKKGPSTGWDNQVIGKLGVDYSIDERWTVRSGLGVKMPPTVKRSNTISNFLLPLFVVKYYVAMGATYQLNCDTEITFDYTYYVNRYQRGERLAALENGHLDVEFQAHGFWLGIGKTF